MRCAVTIILLCLHFAPAKAQKFTLQTVSDSLSWLVLTTDSTEDRWRLPYPVYQFQTGDIDGNGIEDAIVGVIKPTRFYPEPARRLFIFKNFRSKVRPMWMGSHLGGILQDFRFIDQKGGDNGQMGLIRSLQTTTSGKYVVADYRWQGFGMGFERFIVKAVGRDEAVKAFNSDH